MATQIVTLDDLHYFKTELFSELRDLLRSQGPAVKKWLKTYEVKDMLGLSSGTLQAMRSNGTIRYVKIGGLVFYDYDDIMKLMEAQKKGGTIPPTLAILISFFFNYLLSMRTVFKSFEMQSACLIAFLGLNKNYYG